MPSPRGQWDDIDDQWRDECLDALRRRGWDQRRLAAEVKIHPSMITRLLRPHARQKARTSRHARSVSDILGVMLPRQREPPEMARIRSAVARLKAKNPAGLEALLSLLERLGDTGDKAD